MPLSGCFTLVGAPWPLGLIVLGIHYVLMSPWA